MTQTISHGGSCGAHVGEVARSAASSTIMLPLPPTANKIWRRAGRVIHLSDDYKSWKAVAGKMIMAARLPRVPGRYELQLDLPRKMRGDAGNREKATSDLLVQMGIVDDDRFCDRLIISRADDVPAKQCRITVTAIQQEKEQ